MQINSAQDYTTALKRRVVAKSIDRSPQPAHRRYNYVPISVQANRANQVVKQISIPQKSCSGGWVDKSDCCYNPRVSATLVLDFGEAVLPAEGLGSICACGQNVCGDCPGPCVNMSFESNTMFTLSFAGGSGYEYGTTIGIFNFTDFPMSDFSGTIATIDNVPTTVSYTAGQPIIYMSFPPGTLTSSSVISVTLPTAISYLDAVCIGSFPS